VYVGTGEGLLEARLDVAGVERHPDEERERPVVRVPERQARGAERAAVDVEHARIGLIGDEYDVGDRGVGDRDAGQGLARLHQLGPPDDDVNLGLRVLDEL
jgi:hypothetical protein